MQNDKKLLQTTSKKHQKYKKRTNEIKKVLQKYKKCYIVRVRKRLSKTFT